MLPGAASAAIALCLVSGMMECRVQLSSEFKIEALGVL